MKSQKLAFWLWSMGTWLASRRRPRIRPEDYRPYLYRHQTRLLGVRMIEWLRDRLRPAWLRLRITPYPEEPDDRALP